ncbi:PPOX class F420-dependent oxidoreductase [Agromyces atrinae]|uniref:PPOX class F420-dependent oxidoreductase n=1 Tax=Agromyces atrinae TaxID=592376 RepID=A0A4Q2MCD5_9MICO|nr:PPOX class F420-dependent oxidoreductase [Agromyces atrinae]MCI2956535.1 PPOX class F420-dependent oxidoreductase [Agromyces atrinae]NYD68091.1 PPOX class probable F420-dependent enzyme [Agromyces atrinae]RXZ87761.1 PPOX class F420-dependent oxidoreductase [Agromyces atrinae]
MLSDAARTLAKGKNFASLTTLRKDGSPTAQVMWVDCDDEHILINTEVHRLKYKHMKRDPRVTVLIIDQENPYSYAEVRGEVVEFIGGDAARAHIDELSELYFGRPYKPEQIESERVICKIKPVA